MKNPLKNIAPLKEMTKPSDPAMKGGQESGEGGNPSMKELQKQAPNRVDSRGQQLERPRLAQGRKKQQQPAAPNKKSALKKAAKHAVPALASLGGVGGTLFFSSLS